MNEHKILSIVIPVFNTECYLAKCMESIINQNCIDMIEIILVDDGSTDRSGEICESYSREYKNIFVIHQNNQGQSVARNKAINVASGKYIMFVDSDDYLVRNVLKKIIDKLNNSSFDLLICYLFCENINGTLIKRTPRKLPEGIYSNVEYITKSKKNKIPIMYGPVSYICRLDYLIENKLFFKPNIVHEDELWVVRVISSAEKIYNFPIEYYVALAREGSTTRSRENYIYRSNSLAIVADELISIANKMIVKDNDSKILKKYIADRGVTNYFRSIDYSDMKHISEKFFLSRTEVLKYAISASNRLKALVYLLSPMLFFRLEKIRLREI